MKQLKDYNITENQTSTDKTNTIRTLEHYADCVRVGLWQDQVLAGREAKQRGDTETYKRIKSQSVFITPTGTYKQNEPKIKANFTPNGIVVIDVDCELTKEQENALWNDQYTMLMHKSFGGDGWCIFVRVNPDKIDYAYHAVSKYYLEQYDIATDMSCSNSNRGRYASFDPDIHYNPQAKQFTVKIEKKDKEPTKQQTQYIFTNSDFDNILDQIRDKHVDLCNEDYYRYLRIGMSLANHFGESGRSHFHFICSYGSKYNERHTNKDYDGFVKSNDGRATIGTFYYYCKDAGISLYSEKTKTIINRVKVAKSQGNPTTQSITHTLQEVNKITPDDEDIELITKLINSNEDYSTLSNEDLSEIEQMGNFIVDAFSPSVDEITHVKYINGERLDDRLIDDIYIACKKNLDFKVTKADVLSVLNSSYVKRTNILKDFLRENKELDPKGYIDDYASLIYPQTEYNKWAFKKWIVGMMHNWFCDYNHPESCPLTLVLTGQNHGIGKSSFFRNIMPKHMRDYVVESKLSMKDKDSMVRMAKFLIVFDDEFGGKAFKDDKEFKNVSDQTHITLRVAYGREDTRFRRRAILCGASNELDVLKDPTGNRRILPIYVESVNYEAMTSFDTTSLLMEAYNLYKSGFEWRIFSQEDKQYLHDNTTNNQAVLHYEEVFFKYFSLERTFDHNIEQVYNQGEVLQFMHQNSGMKPNKFEIKEIFVKNNLQYKNHNGKKGVRLWTASFNPHNGNMAETDKTTW